ncbi:MAG: hypothetical protein R2752_08830 [Vicinamibacterales bacterium]
MSGRFPTSRTTLARRMTGAVVMPLAVVAIAGARPAVGAQDPVGSQDPVAASAAAPVAGPVVSIWYRGTPAGTPSLEDLGELQALGFASVTWPASQSAGAAAVLEEAARIGLHVSVRGRGVSAQSAMLAGVRWVDVPVGDVDARDLPAIVWRAVAHGARAIAFDAGETGGRGWRDAKGDPRPWLEHARALARQFRFNADLLGLMSLPLPVVIDPPVPAGLEVGLFDATRVWVLIATNTSRATVKAVAHLPKDTPPALWTSLIDGEGMSMLDEPAGPRWTFEIPRGGALVYAINKTK